MPLYNLPLVFWGELHKITTPPPDSNDQIAVSFWVLDRILEFIHIQYVQLQLLSAYCRKVLYQLPQLRRPHGRIKNAMA